MAGVSARVGGRRFVGALAVIGGVATAAAAEVFVHRCAPHARRAPVRASAFAVRRNPKPLSDLLEIYVEYVDGRSLRVDVCVLSSRDRRTAPITVYVHDGGWMQGALDEASADLRWFADRGYVVVAPAHSLATEDRPTWNVAMPQLGMRSLGRQRTPCGAEPTLSGS